MKKILVTGATGFIGSYVVQELLKNNYEVIATSMSAEKAKGFNWFSKVKYIPFRLQEFDDKVNWYNFFQSPDGMIHLAWEGLPNYKSSFHIAENLPRHHSLLTNLVHNGLKDITVAGTCFEYGMQEGCLSEDMPSLPANPYAIAKDLLRKNLQHLRMQQNFELKWPRLFYMYGKGQNPNSLLSQLDRALANGDEVFNMSGGEQERDSLPVERVAEYLVKISLQNRTTDIINCCSGRPVSVREFVKKYLATKQKKITLNFGYYPYPDYEPMSFWGDDKKLKTIIHNE